VATSKQKKSVETSISEVTLRFLEGENEGVEIRVNPPRQLTIGRGEECDIFLGEKKISRKHCSIFVEANGIKVVDLQSTNGTYVNKKKVIETKLQNEDKIQVGTTVVQVSIHYEKEVSRPGAKPAIDLEENPRNPTQAAVGGVSEAPEEVGAVKEYDAPSGVMDARFEEEESFDIDIRKRPSKGPEREVEPSETIDESLEKKSRPLSGNLSAMGLADLLQNLSQNRKSGILKLISAKEGKISVVEGRVIGAEIGTILGEKAIYRMLGWNDGEFELLPLPPNFDAKQVKKPITESMESLLMEGFRQFDEIEKIKKGLPPLSSGLKLKPDFTAPLSKLHPRVLDVLQLVINKGKLEAVLDLSPFSDLETSKIIFYLLKKEYIIQFHSPDKDQGGR